MVCQIGRPVETRGNNSVPKPSRQSTIYKQNDSTRYKSACQPACKADIQTKPGQSPNSESTQRVFSLNHRRRIDYKEKKPRGPDRSLRRRLVRRREFQNPERVTRYPIWHTCNVELKEARCGLHVNHRSRVHCMLRDCKGLAMDHSILNGTKDQQKQSQNETNPDIIYRQRSSSQADKDPNVPLANLTHRTPVPLYTGTSGSENHPDNWNKRQKQSSGSPHEALTNELDWAMEDGNLHWIETIQWD